MVRKRVFVAFDYDDKSVKGDLIAQSKLPDCPFDLIDCSIEKPIDKNWPLEAERRIRACECVIILCGEQTHQAGGASTELQIAQNMSKRHFFLAATRQSTPTPPDHTPKGTLIWTWTWQIVTDLLDGKTPPQDTVRRRL
jgi:hypothetical protein